MSGLSVIVGLASAVLFEIFFSTSKKQYEIFIVCQAVSICGTLSSFTGLYYHITPLCVVGSILYATSSFPSFPIMMELIGKRVGKELQLVATGNVFILNMFETAVGLVAVGSMLTNKTGSFISFVVLIVLLGLNGVCGVLALKKKNTVMNTKLPGLKQKSTSSSKSKPTSAFE